MGRAPPCAWQSPGLSPGLEYYRLDSTSQCSSLSVERLELRLHAADRLRRERRARSAGRRARGSALITVEGILPHIAVAAVAVDHHVVSAGRQRAGDRFGKRGAVSSDDLRSVGAINAELRVEHRAGAVGADFDLELTTAEHNLEVVAVAGAVHDALDHELARRELRQPG